MKKMLAVAVLLGLAGCAVVPAGTSYQTTTVQTSDGQTVTTEEFDYTGYSTPIIVSAYPGVAFYPRYIVDCLCIWPVAFYNGAWINYLGVPIVYRGYWSPPPRHIRDTYLWGFRTNPHRPEFNRAPPGHPFHRPPSWRPGQHAVPPQQPRPPQHIVPQQRPQMHRPPPQQRPQIQRPQPQARPPHVQRPVPQRAPQQQRHCQPGQRC